MKLLLVRPHAYLKVARALQKSFLHLEPLDLEMVAGGVTRGEVKILDLSLEKRPRRAFADCLRQYRPQVIGFGGYSSNNREVKLLAAQAKGINKNILTIAGGVHATIVPHDFKDTAIDLVVRGEGACLIQQVLDLHAAGKPVDIPGRVFSTGDKEFDKKAAASLPAYPAAGQIPLPRRDLVDRKKYFCVWTSAPDNRLKTMFPATATLRTSVGCAFKCSFCVVHLLMGGKYLQRAPQAVVDEIAALKEEYVYFVDDEMFLNTERACEIARLLLARGVNKRYVSWARSDTIVKHPEVFKLWRAAGLDTVYVGLESMDEGRLKEYSKCATAATNRRAIDILKDIGVMLHAAFIVHPDFTAGDFKALEQEIKNITPAEITFTVLAPSPGTEFWRENKERFICDPYRFYDCMHSVLPVKMPLQRFYQHFGRLTQLALRANPLRIKKVRVPLRDFIRAIAAGTRYIFSLYLIYKDYPEQMWRSDEHN